MPQKTAVAPAPAMSDISGGLPVKELWRESIALKDMDGDGFPDIVVPAPRKASEEQNRPRIFLWDQKNKIWNEGALVFPHSGEYGYGGVAVGDLNRDGFPDVVFAVHSGTIIILQNDNGKGFIDTPFPAPRDFHSRAVEISDLNGDGWPDIVAISEVGTTINKSNGILLGTNKQGKGWDISIVGGSEKVSGDSIAVGDLRGLGIKDIIVAPLTFDKNRQKIVWFGDGKGNFREYNVDFTGDTVPSFVRAGDFDGEGRDEIVLKLSGVGKEAKSRLAAFKWTGEGFEDLSGGLEAVDVPIVFDLADIDGDGKKEMIVLAGKGIGIYHYENDSKKWVEKARYPLPPADTRGVFDVRAARSADGSVIVVYNLGGEDPLNHRGIKAFRLN